MELNAPHPLRLRMFAYLYFRNFHSCICMCMCVHMASLTSAEAPPFIVGRRTGAPHKLASVSGVRRSSGYNRSFNCHENANAPRSRLGKLLFSGKANFGPRFSSRHNEYRETIVGEVVNHTYPDECCCLRLTFINISVCSWWDLDVFCYYFFVYLIQQIDLFILWSIIVLLSVFFSNIFKVLVMLFLCFIFFFNLCYVYFIRYLCE